MRVVVSEVSVCTLRDTLPATYPHMLAFPLHLALMTDGSFPFGAIGLVHIANTITQHRPVRTGEKLSIRVWATQLEPHPSRRQFTIRSGVGSNGERLIQSVGFRRRRDSPERSGPALRLTRLE